MFLIMSLCLKMAYMHALAHYGFRKNDYARPALVRMRVMSKGCNYVLCHVFAVDFLACKGERRNHEATCTLFGTRNTSKCSSILPTWETPNSLLSSTPDIFFLRSFERTS